MNHPYIGNLTVPELEARLALLEMSASQPYDYAQLQLTRSNIMRVRAHLLRLAEFAYRVVGDVDAVLSEEQSTRNWARLVPCEVTTMERQVVLCRKEWEAKRVR